MIITIDGPVATGKSTIAKKVAELLGFVYIDTGAMYRCLTYGILNKGISSDHLEELVPFLETFKFEFRLVNGEKCYFVDGKDVTLDIRNPNITSAVSKISAIREVRNKLVSIQRELAEKANSVCEGRDLGSVVFPQADIKIFLTGSDEVRAQRRLTENKEKFPNETRHLTLEEAIKEITARDRYDSERAHSPLTKAEDAIEIDTTHLSVAEIVDKIVDLVENRKG